VCNAGIELAPRPGKVGQRAMDVFRRCFDPHPLARMPEWPWPTLSPTQLGDARNGKDLKPQ